MLPQVFSDGSTGSGVFWMFYQGADFESMSVPGCLQGSIGEDEIEGLRMRPALAMSQVRLLCQTPAHAAYDETVLLSEGWEELGAYRGGAPHRSSL